MGASKEDNAKTIRAFCVVNILYWFALYTFTSYLSPFIAELGGSATIAGLIVGSYGMAMFLCRIPIGILSDRTGKRKIFVMAGTLTVAVAAIGIGVARDPVTVLVFRILSGIGVSTWVCSTVLYNSYFPPSESGKAMASASLSSGIGRCLAGVAGAAAAACFGMRGAFIVGGVAGLIGFAMSFSLKETNTHTGKHMSFAALTHVIRDKSLIFASVLCAVAQMISYATGMSFASDLAVRLGANDFLIGLLGMMLAFGSVIGLYALRRVSYKYLREKTVLLLCFLVMALTCLAFPMVRGMGALYIIQFASGISSGVVGAINMAMSIRFIEKERQATAMGIYQAVYASGILLGPVIIGLLIDRVGYTYAFWVMGIFAIFGLLGIVAWYNGSQKREAEDKGVVPVKA